MPISSSGPISFADLQTEFGGSNPISMAEYFLSEEGFGGTTSEVTGRGYFCAGNDGNEIDGIQFSNEAAINPAATIPTARNIYNSSVQSSTRGYLAGGIQSSVYQTTIDGLQFSDETAITTGVGLKANRAYAAGVQSSIRGYFAGGANTTVSFSSEIEGFTFSTQTVTDPAATLTVARWYPGGISSQVRGYFAGGQSSGGVSQEIDGLIFSSETSTNPTAILGIGRRAPAGVNDAYTGFFGGGTYSGLNTNYIDGFRFDTESHIHGLSATLATGRNEPASCESCIRGYWGGGWTGANSSEIDGIVFTSQTAINPAATLATARTVAAGVNSPSVQNKIPTGRGYFSPGDNLSTVANQVETHDFATETNFIASATMSSVRQLTGGVYSDTKGYWCGGVTVTSEIDGIQFSDETSINPAAALNVARYWLAGVSSPTRGYLAGGTSTSPTPTDWLSEIDGIQFSNETAINPSATLSAGRYGPAGFNSLTKGYWAGGLNSSSVNVTTIDGIQFSSEAVTATTSLLTATRAAGATSGPAIGYVAGGNGLGSAINSFDYRDESVNYVSTTLRQQRERLAGINNSFVGLYAGGLNGGVVFSVMDGIKFTDQSTHSTLASLSDSKMNMTGVSAKAKTSTTNRLISVSNFRSFNSYRGYLSGGGLASGGGSRIDGIKFIDDTSFVSAAALSGGANTISERSGVSSSSKGYWCGGGADFNWIEPLRFIDETYIGVVAALSSARSRAAGVSSANRGYVGGGFSEDITRAPNPQFNVIDGIQFSDDTSFITNATLGLARSGLAGVNSLTRGYFAGGTSTFPPSDWLSEIDGIQFSDETAINPAAVLSLGRRYLSGVSSQTKGYFGGGFTTTYQSEIDGIQFSDETAINPSATLSVARNSLGSVSSTSKGYWAGGLSAGGNTSEIDGIQFQDESAFNPSAALSQTGYRFSGTQSSPPRNFSFHGIENNLSMRRGYLAGGQGGSGNEIDGIQFSDETAINPSVTLSVARSTTMGIGSGSRGYWAGGVQVINSTTPYRIIDGILLSDEASIVIGSALATARFGGGAVGTSIKGYWAGGQTTSSTSSQTNEIDAMIYATETSSNPSMTLPTSRHGISSSYSLTRGYFYGGFAGGTGELAEIDGIQFSDETAINPAAALSEPRKWSAGVTNVNNGYLGGGFINGNADTSSIIKFAYSTETRTNLGITLSVVRRSLGAVNSSLRGYWAAGTGNNPADIDGIQFSDETAINPAATLSNPRDTISGLQSYSFMLTGSTLSDPSIISASMYRGYFGGGVTSSAESNEIDGFQFSNESAINPIATLSVARQGLAGINSWVRGYFAGGYQLVTYYTEIDGIQFSNESAINPGAALSVARTGLAGWNSSLYGFLAGGEDDGTVGLLTTIQGFRFSDETTFTPFNSSSLGTAKQGMATVDNTLATRANHSYIAGGLVSGGTVIGTIQRYRYYNELIATVGATLSVSRRSLAGVSSPGKGYFCGGFSSSTWQSEIDGINYATDAAVNPSATLSVARTNLSGVNSLTRGYFAGGNSSGGVLSEIDGIQFSDETAINPSATLSVARDSLAGVQSGAR